MIHPLLRERANEADEQMGKHDYSPSSFKHITQTRLYQFDMNMNKNRPTRTRLNQSSFWQELEKTVSLKSNLANQSLNYIVLLRFL